MTQKIDLYSDILRTYVSNLNKAGYDSRYVNPHTCDHKVIRICKDKTFLATLAIGSSEMFLTTLERGEDVFVLSDPDVLDKILTVLGTICSGLKSSNVCHIECYEHCGNLLTD